MTPLEILSDATPYSVSQPEKSALMLRGLNALTALHAAQCSPYRRILDGAWGGAKVAANIADIPYLPVSLFKTHLLQSVPDDQVRMIMTSSGTTGQAVSRIAVDAVTSGLQQRGLAHCMSHMLGNKRIPMLVIDSADVFKDPRKMSARGAGVLGLMRYGRDHCFALDGDMQPVHDAVRTFLKKYEGQPIFLFGFTYIVWLHFYQAFRDADLDLSHATLIHSGGWKKMAEQAVDNDVFRAAFKQDFGLTRIFNFYGMVEQLGALCVEGQNGLLFPPNFADVIIRCPETWAVQPDGTEGLIQIMSLLPHSYPGHSLLTEDIGVIQTLENTIDHRTSRGFRVLRRVKNAELRGCSDVAAKSGLERVPG